MPDALYHDNQEVTVVDARGVRRFGRRCPPPLTARNASTRRPIRNRF